MPTPPISGGSVVRNAVLHVHGYASANTGGSGRGANAYEVHATSLARLSAGCQRPDAALRSLKRQAPVRWRIRPFLPPTQPAAIVESYYNAQVAPGVLAAADVQRIQNPGYNRERGPVWVFGLRLHLEL